MLVGMGVTQSTLRRSVVYNVIGRAIANTFLNALVYTDLGVAPPSLVLSDCYGQRSTFLVGLTHNKMYRLTYLFDVLHHPRQVSVNYRYRR